MKWMSGLILWCCSMVCGATTLDQLVVFGDSLSDNGNLYEFMHHQMPLSPPYYKGHFTNGPVWAEALMDHYYPKTATTHLQDYAFGGTGVEGPDDEPDDILFTLRREVDSYLFTHDDKASPNSLYVIWIGANNYLSFPDDQNKMVSDVNWGIQVNVERLIEHGARHIMLVNLPNIGQSPIATDFDAVDELTRLSMLHNDQLKNNLEQWKVQYPDVHWMFFDVNAMLTDMVDHPDNFGLTNTDGTCYEELLDPPSSQTILKMVSHVQAKPYRANACDGYLFFDPMHPTAIAHQQMADKVVQMLKDEGIEFQ